VKIGDYALEGFTPRGKPKKMWKDVVEKKKLSDSTAKQGRLHCL